MAIAFRTVWDWDSLSLVQLELGHFSIRTVWHWDSWAFGQFGIWAVWHRDSLGLELFGIMTFWDWDSLSQVHLALEQFGFSLKPLDIGTVLRPLINFWPKSK